MRNKLETYIELLFAGNPEAQELKQDILQHTLDHYDDLIAQGKKPEAAYSLAIAGIGDISELLAGQPVPSAKSQEGPRQKVRDQRMQAVAVALYILCPVPLLLIHNVVGLSLMFVFIAAATALMVLADREEKKLTPRPKLAGTVQNGVAVGGVVLYLLLSFTTRAWGITWLIFPIVGAVNGLIRAVADYLDCKEVPENEK